MSVEVLTALSIVLTIIAVPVMNKLVRILELERVNFRGARIPSGYGFILVLVSFPLYVADYLTTDLDPRAAALMTAVLTFGVLGLVDDVYGNRSAGGFTGHLGLLRRGKISTGFFKAAVGGLVALALGFAIARFNVWIGLLNGLLIALSANTLNLLDLRPGRAVSCFWIGVLVLAIPTAGRTVVVPWLIPVMVSAIWLTLLDRSARVMMGDAGSNVLGAVLGVAILNATGIAGRLVVLLFMIAVHLYSEKYSISKLIESNRVLRRLDSLLGVR